MIDLIKFIITYILNVKHLHNTIQNSDPPKTVAYSVLLIYYVSYFDRSHKSHLILIIIIHTPIIHLAIVLDFIWKLM